MQNTPASRGIVSKERGTLTKEESRNKTHSQTHILFPPHGKMGKSIEKIAGERVIPKMKLKTLKCCISKQCQGRLNVQGFRMTPIVHHRKSLMPSFFILASIIMTTSSTLLALVLMPLCLWIYSRAWIDTPLVRLLPLGAVTLTLCSTLLPISLGVFIRYRYSRVADILLKVSFPCLLYPYAVVQMSNFRRFSQWGGL